MILFWERNAIDLQSMIRIANWAHAYIKKLMIKKNFANFSIKT